MKKAWPVLLIGAVLLLGGGVYVVTQHLSGNYLRDQEKNQEVAGGSCKGRPSDAVYKVQIKNDKVYPEHTQASQCSTLIIGNYDDRVRKIAFGQHDHHQTYNGVTEKILTRNQSLSVVLAAKGHYMFHDHNQDEVIGDVTID
jgi:hypothetical protein